MPRHAATTPHSPRARVRAQHKPRQLPHIRKQERGGLNQGTLLTFLEGYCIFLEVYNGCACVPFVPNCWLNMRSPSVFIGLVGRECSMHSALYSCKLHSVQERLMSVFIKMMRNVRSHTEGSLMLTRETCL